MNAKDCIFCARINTPEIILQNEYCFAVPDLHPVTEGHTLIIPKRHFPDYFEASQQEIRAIHDLLRTRKCDLQKIDPAIKGFNVGINIDQAAGQSIFHVHVHLIPRRAGDTDNPKGGVRGVIPGRMGY